MVDLGFDFVLSLGWRNPDRAICPCESDRRSQTVYASKKEKWKRRGVTGELVGGKEGGKDRLRPLESPRSAKQRRGR
ncbi:hypothetical protein PAMP_008098 [Pampus punctatissimus]